MEEDKEFDEESAEETGAKELAFEFPCIVTQDMQLLLYF